MGGVRDSLSRIKVVVTRTKPTLKSGVPTVGVDSSG